MEYLILDNLILIKFLSYYIIFSFSYPILLYHKVEYLISLDKRILYFRLTIHDFNYFNHKSNFLFLLNYFYLF